MTWQLSSGWLGVVGWESSFWAGCFPLPLPPHIFFSFQILQKNSRHACPPCYPPPRRLPHPSSKLPSPSTIVTLYPLPQATLPLPQDTLSPPPLLLSTPSSRLPYPFPKRTNLSLSTTSFLCILLLFSFSTLMTCFLACSSRWTISSCLMRCILFCCCWNAMCSSRNRRSSS